MKKFYAIFSHNISRHIFKFPAKKIQTSTWKNEKSFRARSPQRTTSQKHLHHHNSPCFLSVVAAGGEVRPRPAPDDSSGVREVEHESVQTQAGSRAPGCDAAATCAPAHWT